MITKYGLTINMDPQFDFSRVEINSIVSPFTSDSEFVTVVEKIPFSVSEFFNVDECSLHEENMKRMNIMLHVKIPEGEHSIDIKGDFNKNTIAGIFIECDGKAKINIETAGGSEFCAEYIFVKGGDVKITTIQDVSFETMYVQYHSSLVSKSVEWENLLLGSKYTRCIVTNQLIEPEASCKNNVYYLAQRNQIFDIGTFSYHKNHHTNSDIITKGVIMDSAKALSRGLVRIEQNAPHSNGYEQQDALLLSEEAEADAIPNLEILNNDVKCSHGSTVGKIDEEKIFYLMSRGLSEKESKILIALSYFPQIEEIQEKIKATLEKQ